jgi:hypothetical protein
MSLNKEIYPFSQRSVPPCSPKPGPLWKQNPIFRALLSISFGVTSKGAFPPGSPHRAPSERDTPFLELPFIHLSTSTVYDPPVRLPNGAPTELDARPLSPPPHIRSCNITSSANNLNTLVGTCV